jgi:signal transduction histidine kinase/CheY-like chemotaxis protein
LYVLYIAFSNDKKILRKFEKYKELGFMLSSFIFLAILAVIMILPINYFRNDTVVYSYGASVDVLFTTTRYIAIFWLVLLFIKRKSVNWKKYIPMLAYIVLGMIISFVQHSHPEYLLYTSLMVFVTFLMFFTIENPDVKMIEALEAAKEDADHANRAKTEFLSSMSHEIRTPLNAIIGFSECIRDAKTKVEAKENAGDIISAANTLLETVNGILDISKIEAGKLELKKTNYDPVLLFNECEKLVTPRINDKGLEFNVSYAKDIPKVLNGDYSNIKKVILNILTNAAKYTDHGSIKFEVHCVNNKTTSTLIISVSDTGRGIKQENIDKLFNKFERGEENNNTSIEGTGLGLAITKQLVHLMNGKITVQSAYGEGSTFTITIPQRIVTDKNVEIINKQETKKIEIEDFSGKMVLVVDDNKLNLKVAEKLLEPFKVEVMTVSSGAECLEAIEMIKADLILMDDMMPHMSGVETLRKLKAKEEFKTPVVALTANAIAGMKEKYLKDGFNDYLAKPIERPELSRVLNKFFNK